MPYSRPIVTIDIDGVLANTGYLPKPQQGSYEHYVQAKPFPEAYELLHWLYQHSFETWFLTARSFPGAQALTEAWVHRNFGNLNPWYHKKVLTGISDDSIKKYIIANELGSVLHIDDDWRTFVAFDKFYKNRTLFSLYPFSGTTIWIDNWANKTTIPNTAYDLVNDNKLWCVSTLKEALELVQQLTPKLLGKNT